MKKLRIGIIGTGSIAQLHLDAYRKNPAVEVRAVCDQYPGRAEAVAAAQGIELSFTDYRDLLQQKDIDAIDVTTWNNTHEEITLAGLAAGMHVLCEKPPALQASGAERMERAAREQGKILMYGLVRRFGENARVLKSIIDQGLLGDIHFARGVCTRRWGNPGGWFANRAISGGGPLIDLGIHIIDLCTWLMGDLEPVAVFGHTDDSIGPLKHIEGIDAYHSVDWQQGGSNVEDSARAMIRFSNGATMYLETSWVQFAKKDVLAMDFFGNRGGAKLEPILEIYSTLGNRMVDTRPLLRHQTFNFEQALADELRNFADAVLLGAPCLAPASSGVKVMRIIDAIYESARTGGFVSLA